MTAGLDELRRARPRDRFLLWSMVGFAVLLVGSLVFGRFDFGALFNADRGANLLRFFGEVRPYPLQGRDWDWGVAWSWAMEILDDPGGEAFVNTLAISILAIVLAAVVGAFGSLLAARTVATPQPYAPEPKAPTPRSRTLWSGTARSVRFVFVLVRSVPEYILAFILLALLSSSAWPVVLALAIHNAGILGRLYAESIENQPPATMAWMRAVGGRRRHIAVGALWPAVLGRGLLYAFYRWETCVREATVLGMLGVASLGYFIHDARIRGKTDEFVFLIGLGVVLVFLGDLVSSSVRRLVR